MTRIAVGRRQITRAVHYTGIDSNRPHLEPLDAIARSAARARQACDPSKRTALNAPLGDAYALSGRIQERFIRAELNLNDRDRLAAQLAELLRKDRFDEIHVHLLHPGKHGCQPVGPQVLRALAKYLRPGARLYHLFQHSSPFFDFRPERLRPSREGLCPAAGSPADALSRNEARFRQGALRGGLLLEKCGLRWEKLRILSDGSRALNTHENWVTRRFAGPEPDRRTAETYQRLAEQYSGYSTYASHFVILRKQTRRPGGVGRRRATRLTGV